MKEFSLRVKNDKVAYYKAQEKLDSRKEDLFKNRISQNGSSTRGTQRIKQRLYKIKTLLLKKCFLRTHQL